MKWNRTINMDIITVTEHCNLSSIPNGNLIQETQSMADVTSRYVRFDHIAYLVELKQSIAGVLMFLPHCRDFIEDKSWDDVSAINSGHSWLHGGRIHWWVCVHHSDGILKKGREFLCFKLMLTLIDGANLEKKRIVVHRILFYLKFLWI